MIDFSRMKAALLSMVFACAGSVLHAQAIPTPASPGNGSADLGFSYTVPHDWEVLSIPPTMDQARSQATQNAGTDAEKKGLACLEPVLTARDKKSGSILSVEALPFSCFGQA